MNSIILLILFSIILANVSAIVEVIAVRMPLFATAHAAQLTQVINKKEEGPNGCVFFNSEAYGDATYLYFRCAP